MISDHKIDHYHIFLLYLSFVFDEKKKKYETFNIVFVSGAPIDVIFVCVCMSYTERRKKNEGKKMMRTTKTDFIRRLWQ